MINVDPSGLCFSGISSAVSSVTSAFQGAVATAMSVASSLAGTASQWTTQTLSSLTADWTGSFGSGGGLRSDVVFDGPFMLYSGALGPPTQEQMCSMMLFSPQHYAAAMSGDTSGVISLPLGSTPSRRADVWSDVAVLLSPLAVLDAPKHWVLGMLGTRQEELVDAVSLMRYNQDRAEAARSPIAYNIFVDEYAAAHASGAFDPQLAPNRWETSIGVGIGTEVVNPLTYTPLVVSKVIGRLGAVRYLDDVDNLTYLDDFDNLRYLDDATTTNANASRLYETGLAKDLRMNPVTGTQVNHVPQSRQAESLIGNFNLRNKVGNEAAIRLPISEHDAVSAAQQVRRVPASARDLLADEIRILRNNTNAPNSPLKELIRMNKDRHFWDFLPVHRMKTP